MLNLVLLEKEYELEMMKIDSLFESALNQEIISWFDDTMLESGVGSLITKAGEVINKIIAAIKKFFTELKAKVARVIQSKGIKSKLIQIKEELKGNPHLRNEKITVESSEKKKEIFKQFLTEMSAATIRLCKAKNMTEYGEISEEIDKIHNQFDQSFYDANQTTMYKVADEVFNNLNKDIESIDINLNAIGNSTEKILVVIEKQSAQIAEDDELKVQKLSALKQNASKISSASQKMGKWIGEHPFKTFAIVQAAIGTVVTAVGIKQASDAKNIRDMDSKAPQARKIEKDHLSGDNPSYNKYLNLKQKEANRQAKEKKETVKEIKSVMKKFDNVMGK